MITYSIAVSEKTKFEMLRDSLREVRESIDSLQTELDAGYCKFTYFAWSDALEMERKILAEMERTE